MNGEVTIHLSGMHSATVTSLVPSTEYSLSLVGVFDDVTVRLAEIAQEMGLTQWDISLTHTKEYAAAVAVAMS